MINITISLHDIGLERCDPAIHFLNLLSLLDQLALSELYKPLRLLDLVLVFLSEFL